MKFLRIGLMALALAAGPVSSALAAGPWAHLYFGAGYDDPNDKTGTQSGAVMLGFGGGGWAPFASTGGRYDFIASMRIRPRVTGEVTFDGDYFLGGGLSFEVHLWSPVFLEAGFQPGFYVRDGSLYLPQFRSHGGIGINLGNRYTLGLFVNHKSNGKLGREDSSVETALIRFGWAY